MCYLPLFDREALAAIKDALEGTRPDNGQLRVAAAVVRAPQVFDRNPHLPAEIFDFVGALPSIPTPDRSASPLRRASMNAGGCPTRTCRATSRLPIGGS
jgi:hypothetical protein